MCLFVHSVSLTPQKIPFAPLPVPAHAFSLTFTTNVQRSVKICYSLLKKGDFFYHCPWYKVQTIDKIN